MTPEELGQLIDRYAAALVLYARQWCAMPEDVVQESFVKLMRQSPVPTQIRAWLYCVVRNGAISQARSAKRRAKYEMHVASRSPGFVELSDDPTGLDGTVVIEALEGLPVEQREIIIAHLWGGLTFEEIAELVNTSSSTAFRRYHAGLERLRQQLGVSCPI